MRWLTVLALYQVVYGRIQWLSSRPSSQPSSQIQSQQQQQNLDINDIFANILNDLNLDITFNNNQNNDFFIDESPSSMFSFPSFPQFFNSPSISTSTSTTSSNKPLYLMVQSFGNNRPQITSSSSSVFVLEESNKVNGNTYRYSVKSNGNGNKIITETWSSSPKMYLCNSKSCGRSNGIEMVNIFDNSMNDGPIKKYMHLVPSTTVQTMDDEDSFYDDYPFSISFMDQLMNKVKDCHGKMKEMLGMNDMDNNGYMYYDTESDIMPQEIPSSYQKQEGGEDDDGYIRMNDDRILADDGNGNDVSSVSQHENDDLLLAVMGVIMILIMICGVLYAVRRYLMDRKERNRMDDYVQMQENDMF